MKLPKIKLSKTFEHFRQQLKNKLVSYAVVNALIIFLEFFYIATRVKFLNKVLPFFYTRLWGDYQLVPKQYIYLIPLISIGITLVGLGFLVLNKYFIRYFTEVVSGLVLLCNVFLAGALYRIVQISSVPFEPLLNPLYVNLLLPFILAFFGVYILLPRYIDFAHSKKLVTNPALHSHPAMLLKEPSARGGGLIYAFVFLVLALLFAGFNSEYTGLYISLVMVSLLGLIDDIQNTNSNSNLKVFEKPLLRFFLLFLSILPVILSGNLIYFVSSPLGGVFDINLLNIEVLGSVLPVVSILVTSVWMIWVMNILSWSNGIDGQYAGIIGISSLIIAFLALRFDPIESSHIKIGILAAISAGAAFGFTKYTWSPSKVMWSFGAMNAGLLISSLSIAANTKIVVSVMLILVPFMDGVVTFVRRIMQGKNPMKGDRGHLHHLLLSRGWSCQKIALFYWFTTAVFGGIGLLTPERYSLQIMFLFIGGVAFFIALINMKSIKGKKNSQEAALTSPKVGEPETVA